MKYKFQIYPEKGKSVAVSLLAPNQPKYRWRLVAPNGRTIGDSGEGYDSKSNCERAVHSVIAGVLVAVIESAEA